MSLVFTAIIPNNSQSMQEMHSTPQTPTAIGLKELIGENYFMKPDTIVVLTSEGNVVPELINTNIANRLITTVDGKEHSFNGDVEFATHLKTAVDNQSPSIPMTIIAEAEISMNIGSPMAAILHHLDRTRVVVISTSVKLSLEEHVQFGKFLRHHSLDTNKRISVMAAVSIHADTDESLQQLETIITQKAFTDVQALSQINGLGESKEPLAVLFGLLQNINVAPEILSTEQRESVGYIVSNLVIQ